MRNLFGGAVLAAVLGVMSITGVGCGDDSGGYYACSYEQRRTEGCSATTWGSWAYECVDFNSDDYYITPQEVCANLTSDDLYCEAGCCIDYEHRSIDLSPGTCY
jgi:hypothetical protein